MKKILVFASVSLLLFGIEISKTFAQEKLLRVGKFHGDEVAAQSGETWYGLIPGMPNSTLQPFKIKIERFHDDLIDEGRQKTGKKVSVASSPWPVILIQGLQPGPVPTIFTALRDPNFSEDYIVKNPIILSPGEKIIIKQKGFKESCSLNPQGNLQKESGSVSQYRLEYQCGAIKQILTTIEQSDEVIPQVIWIGDLDGDKKFDLLLDLTNHYNVSDWRLFLSGSAKKSLLLQEFGSFTQSGC